MRLKYNPASLDHRNRSKACASGFTLMEAVIVVSLLGLLVLSSLNAMYSMDLISSRQSIYTAALNIAQGELEEITSYVYNPPEIPFQETTYTTTRSGSLDLNTRGTP